MILLICLIVSAVLIVVIPIALALWNQRTLQGFTHAEMAKHLGITEQELYEMEVEASKS